MVWRKLRKVRELLANPRAACACPEGKVCIGVLPWWPSTYYQARLVGELKALGFSVRATDLSLKRLICLLRGYDCDKLLHVHWPHGLYIGNYWRFPLAILYLACYRLLKRNIVWTVHELEFYETRYPTLDRIMVYFLTRCARALVVHSNYSANVMRERYRFRGRIAVLRHPGEFGPRTRKTISREAARAELSLPARALVYLFVGYIKPYKGVEDLIEAFSKIPADMQCRLVIAGQPLDDETRLRVERLARCDRRVVTHLGFVPEARLPLYMSAADVAVFPFRKIHTSGSLHLAMSYGRPVIAPAIASLPEDVAAEAGVLFDASDPQGLIKAMRAVHGRNLEAMGQCAQASLNGRTWSAFAVQHAQLYAALTEDAELLHKEPSRR